MIDKKFVVVNSKTGHSFSAIGKTLKEALKKEELDPKIWKEIGEPQKVEEEPIGNNQGNAEPEDN